MKLDMCQELPKIFNKIIKKNGNNNNNNNNRKTISNSL